MSKKVVVVLVMAWATLFCLAGTVSAIGFTYQKIDLPAGWWKPGGYPLSINDAGQIVGTSSRLIPGRLIDVPFLITPGQPVKDLGGGVSGWAVKINNSGVICGAIINNPDYMAQACIWYPVADGYYGLCDLGIPGYFHGSPLNFSETTGINDHGVTVGYYGIDNELFRDGSSGIEYVSYFNSLTWTGAGAVQEMNPSLGLYLPKVNAINNSGVMVGELFFSYHEPPEPNASWPNLPALWYPPGGSYPQPMVYLPTFGGDIGSATAINASNQVVGWSTAADNIRHAFLWTWENGLRDLGSLDVGSPPEHHTWACAINDQGWVVGSSMFEEAIGIITMHGFLWTPANGMQDLQALTSNLPAGVTLAVPMGINNRGEIVGFDSQGDAFKLSPMVPPEVVFFINDGALYANSHTVDIEIFGFLGHMTQMRFSDRAFFNPNTGQWVDLWGDWLPYPASHTTKYTFSSPKEGSNYLKAQVMDSYGNVSKSLQRDIILDTVKPTDGSLGAVATSHSITLTSLGFGDATSGLEYYLYSGGTNPTAFRKPSVGGSSLTLTNLQPSTTYYFLVQAVDKAGNVSVGKTLQVKTKAAPLSFLNLLLGD
jgi:probable HAF family extracellular repeat protein